MSRLLLATIQSDKAILDEFRSSLEERGYTISLSSDLQSTSSSRLLERHILGSAALVAIWSAEAQQNEQIERQLLFAQRLRKPLFVVTLDATTLPDPFAHLASIPWQGSSEATVSLLLNLSGFPLIPDTGPFEQLCEQLAHEHIRRRKEAIEQAANMLKRNEHRDELLAILQYLAQNDLMIGVRQLAKEALKADIATNSTSVQGSYEDPIVLSTDPLTASETSITLDIVSETETWRGPLMRKRILEGKITLDPQSARIYALSEPASRHSSDEKRVWDFYLVDIPFNLHKAPGNNFYREVTLFISLDKEGASAFDLFSPGKSIPINEAVYCTVSPDMKIEEREKLHKQVRRSIRLTMLDSLITTYGEGERQFYWTYRGSEEQKGVIPGTRHALFVLRVPHGTQEIDGTITYETVIAKYWRSVWSDGEGKVDPYPVRWNLDETVPLFFPSQEEKHTLPAQKSVRTDVCILCALEEEAEGLKEAFQEELGVIFQRESHSRLKREYDYALISNVDGEELGVLVTWLPNMGSLETSLQLRPLLEEFQPRFAAMTGICAGDAEKVKLGDIVVAERAFLYDIGKLVRGEEGQQKLLHDTQTWFPPPEVIQFARGFHNWQQVTARESRPSTHRQQRDWLLHTLFELYEAHPQTEPQVDEIEMQALEMNAPQWRTIVHALQTGPDTYLTGDRRLKSGRKIADLRYGQEAFPYKDPPQPRVAIAPFASGSAVRSDRPFAMIKIPVRGTVAIDMEGAAFYRTLAEFRNIHSLLVKGVSDFADEYKDDTYHLYASKISARYILAFIREYVTVRRLPISQA